MRAILAIDPGSLKCGLAVVSEERVLHRAIVPREGIVQSARDAMSLYPVDMIVLGNGTGSESLARSLESANLIPIRIVEESFSTLLARARYFKEHPPRGLRRLIPLGLLTPDRPLDDYAAVILGEMYLVNSEQSD